MFWRIKNMKHSIHITLLVILIALFIVTPVFSQKGNPPQKTKELMDIGKKSYDMNCAVCHGLKGNADTPAGKAITPPPPDFSRALKDWPDSKGDTGKIFEVITKGIPNSAMPGWGQLPENERWGLVYYLIEFAAGK
jgi:mono/diheme cytochrome c family protein